MDKVVIKELLKELDKDLDLFDKKLIKLETETEDIKSQWETILSRKKSPYHK